MSKLRIAFSLFASFCVFFLFAEDARATHFRGGSITYTVPDPINAPTPVRFDVIAAGMYITPARCKQVLFTDPQYQLPDALLTAKGNPKALHSYQDIANNPEVKLAIMAGTVNLAYARDSGVKDSQILQVPDTTAQLQAVRAGRADAAVGTQLTMKNLAAKGGEKVEAVTEFKDQAPFL